MAAVNHAYAEQTSAQTNTGTALWTQKGPSLAGTNFTNGTKYLIIAKAVWGGNDDRDLFGIRIATDHDSTIATKSEAQMEPMSEITGRGLGYVFVHSFTAGAVSSPVEFEVKANSSADTVWADQMSLLVIDLDDLGSSNYVEATDAGGGGLTTTWTPTATIAGTSLDADTEYLVLGYQQIIVDDNKTEFESAMFLDNTNSISYHQAEGENTAEIRPVGHFGADTTHATTPVDMYVTNAAEASGDYDEGAAYIIAIKTSAFDQFGYAYETGGATINSSATQLVATTSFTASAGDFLFLGGYNYTEAGTNDLCSGSVYPDGTTEVLGGDQVCYQTQRYDPQDAESVRVMGVETLTATSYTPALKAVATLGDSPTSYGEFVAYLSLELAATGESYSGSITISATTGVTNSGTSARDGSSTISTATAVTNSGTSARSGTTTASAASAATITGSKGSSGSVSISHSTAVTAAGQAGYEGSVTVSTATGVVADHTKGGEGTLSVLTTIGVTGSGGKAVDGTAAASAASAVTVSGEPAKSDSITVSAATGVTASGTKSEAKTGSCSITAATGVTVSGEPARDGAASASAATGVAVSGEPARDGSASVSAASGVTASGSSDRDGTASVSAVSGVTGTGESQRSGAAAAVSAATGVTVSGAPGFEGTASMSAASGVTAAGDTDRSGTASVSAATGVTASGSSARSGAPSAISTASSVTASGSKSEGGVTVTSLDSDVDATGANNPYSTASASPSADATLLVAVVTRANSSAEVPPVVTGGSLTWTLVDSQQHDTSGVLTYMHVFRAETGSSPGTFSLTITCPQDPVGVHWHWVEISGTDLTTNNGVVQSAKNYDDTDTVGTITSTFSVTPGSDNAVVSFCSIQEATSTTFTEDTDYTELAKVGPSESEQSAVQYKEGGSPDTTVVGTWASQVGPIGIISVEVKALSSDKSGSCSVTAATGVTASGSSDRDGTATASAATGVTVSGSPAKSGSTTASAASAATVSGSPAKSGAATVSAATGVTVSGSKSADGTASISAATGVTASGVATEGASGTASITAATSVTVSGSPDRAGSSSDATITDVTVAGSPQKSGTLTEALSSSVVASGGIATDHRSGSASITASTAVTTSGSKAASGPAGVQVLSTITLVCGSQRDGTCTITATTGVEALYRALLEPTVGEYEPVHSRLSYRTAIKTGGWPSQRRRWYSR